MKTLYYITKYKTNISGYWKDEHGKLHKDNILLKPCNTEQKFKSYKNLLFTLKHQQAIFYKIGHCAITENRQGSMQIFNNCISTQANNYKELKTAIKTHIFKYNGATIIRHNNFYTITSWII